MGSFRNFRFGALTLAGLMGAAGPGERVMGSFRNFRFRALTLPVRCGAAGIQRLGGEAVTQGVHRGPFDPFQALRPGCEGTVPARLLSGLT